MSRTALVRLLPPLPRHSGAGRRRIPACGPRWREPRRRCQAARRSSPVPARGPASASTYRRTPGSTWRSAPPSSSPSASSSLLRRTITTPQRWEPDPVDLEAFAGERIDLLFRASSTVERALAFWGHPTVRQNGAGAAAPDSDKPQGVILVIADTLRRDHLSAYGYDRETSPELASLATDGVRFDNAIAQGTWTKISVPSILTSLHPSSHGLVNFTDRLPASITTMAEIFRDAGYATMQTSSVPFSGQLTDLQQGAEVLHESGSHETPEGVSGSKTGRVLTDRVLDWVERHREVPFFAVLHAFDPHSPYEPAPPYRNWWTEADARQKHEEDQEAVKPFIEEWHGTTVYGEQTDVPLVLWGRGFLPAGVVAPQTVQLIDVLPTLTDLAGLPTPDVTQGQSLLPLITELAGQATDAPPWKARPAFSEPSSGSGSLRDELPGRPSAQYAIADGAWKLIEYADPPPGWPRFELFDRTTDPLDQNDLAGAHPDVVENLAEKLAAWRSWAEQRKLEPDSLDNLSAEELARLRSLGYI